MKHIEKLLKEYEEAILEMSQLHSRWSHGEIEKRLDKSRKALAAALSESKFLKNNPDLEVTK